MFTVGLVVEGTHDIIMLAPFIERELGKLTSAAVRLKPLQPAADETGTISDGGWTRVVSWCKQNAGSQIDTFFTPLFSEDVPCDVIVVHLDGDALEHIRPHTCVTIPTSVTDVAGRVRLIVNAIEDWLSIDASRRSKSPFEKGISRSLRV